MDIAFSPQTELFNTSRGPVRVTVEASDNTSLGFRKYQPVTEGPLQSESEFLRAEVRANKQEGEGINLKLTLTGLVAGKYELVTFHHNHSDNECLQPINVSINGREFARGIKQTSGLNPTEMKSVSIPFEVGSGDQTADFCFASTSTIVLNGLHIRMR